MKIFKDNKRNWAYLAYRLINPLFDPIKLFYGISGYFWFVKDLIRYKKMSKNAKIELKNLYPILDEKVPMTPFDSHYFYQQLWVFEDVLKRKPKNHVDVASTYQMSGYLSKITQSTFVDIRPITTNLRNLTTIKGDLVNLNFENNSLISLSCLHSIEHVGLGRYGDTLDPFGTEKACTELKRVLAKNGYLYISVPIGKQRLCFNAHWVFSPQTILNYFKPLDLISFSVVTDDGEYVENVNWRNYQHLNYGCGMFLFTK